jgi:hypothetical protein
VQRQRSIDVSTKPAFGDLARCNQRLRDAPELCAGHASGLQVCRIAHEVPTRRSTANARVAFCATVSGDHHQRAIDLRTDDL